MLVITRKENQSFWVGDCLVTVLKDGSLIKLGISGPKETKVVRAELETRGENSHAVRKCAG